MEPFCGGGDHRIAYEAVAHASEGHVDLATQKQDFQHALPKEQARNLYQGNRSSLVEEHLQLIQVRIPGAVGPDDDEVTWPKVQLLQLLEGQRFTTIAIDHRVHLDAGFGAQVRQSAP